MPEFDPAQVQAGRWKMLAVLLLCAAPVIASYITYYFIRPQARSNYGELITPQQPLPTSLSALKGQWLLLSVADAACTGPCPQNLYFQRQLRTALGPNQDRLDNVWLVTDSAAVPAQLQSALQKMTVQRVPAAQLAQWLTPTPGQRLQDHLYVVDPLGNWMLRFPAHMDLAGAAKAKRDLERLLRASKSWDVPGR